MKVTKDIIRLADEQARKYGYLCASYLGRYKDTFVFACRQSTSSPFCTEYRFLGRTFILYSNLVLVRNGEAHYCSSEDKKKRYCRNLHFRDFAKGRAIYRTYERQYDENDFASEEERENIRNIVENQRTLYERPIPKRELYEYLELASRLGMKPRLVVDINSMEKHLIDGWEYHIHLKPFSTKKILF